MRLDVKVRGIPFHIGHGSHASKFHGVSTRNNVLIGPRENIFARKRILTYLQPFIKVDLGYYDLTSKDFQRARRFPS